MFTLFLDPKGRILFDCHIIKYPYQNTDASLVLDVSKANLGVLEDTLKKYSFRRSVKFSNIDSTHSLLSTFFPSITGDDLKPNSDLIDNESLFPQKPLSSFQDPRLPNLGLRSLHESNQIPSIPTTHSLKHYKTFRMLNVVAEGPAIQNSIPHHFNFHHLNSISLNKGCYVGQELIARTSTQGTVRTGLFGFTIGPKPIDLENYLDCIDWDNNEDHLGKVVLNEKSEEVGVVVESEGKVGLVKAKIEGLGEKGVLSTGEEIFVIRPKYFGISK